MSERQFHFVGLDISITSTGIARVRPQDLEPVTLSLITSTPVPDAKYHHTLARLRRVARDIVKAALIGVEEGDILVFVMEGPIFPSTKSIGHYHTRAGLWWLVYHLIEKLSPGNVVIIEPTKLKSYITGKGNASKDLVLTDMVRHFPKVPIIDNNQADALGLAAMVSREMGFPLERSAHAVNPAALESVYWPELVTAQRAAYLQNSRA